MEIFFNTRKIEKLCCGRTISQRKLGKKIADNLFRSLAQLKASNKLKDFNFDSPHPLKGNKLGKFVIGIDGGWRLIFVANEPIPKTPDGVIDWDNVVEITITSIEDYH